MGSHPIGMLSIEKVVADELPLTISIQSKKGLLIGDETLRVDSLQGQESISQPFEFHVELRGNDYVEGVKKTPTNKPDAAGVVKVEPPQTFLLDDLIGQPASIAYTLPVSVEPTSSGKISYRYFHGLIADFSLAEPGVYRATVKPALWKATLTNRYKLYAGKTIEGVLSEVLSYHGVVFDMYLDSFAINREQDWLQAGETDYEFIQRLMKKAHIYYYFVHEKDKHTMILANIPQYRPLYKTIGDKKIPLVLNYVNTTEPDLAWQSDNALLQYQYKKSLTTSGVHSLLVRSEAVWEHDSVAGYTQYKAMASDVHTLPFQECKVYQYGGDYGEAATLSSKNWEMITSSASSLSGSSNSPILSAGHTFTTMADASFDSPEYRFSPSEPYHEPTAIRKDLENVRFVVTQVQHQIKASEPYSNSFEATEATALITPFNIQDTQQGSVLGKVVATGGAEYPNGWKYREKNNFSLETNQADDSNIKNKQGVFNEKGVFVELVTDEINEQGPVWIKLAQTMQTVPEVGVAVQVGRSNDESEMPEIQSIVHSNGSKVIMPSGWTANTTVGSNYSTSYGDSKGIRFGLYSNANLEAAINIIEKAYATGRYKDVSYSQGAGYSYSTSENGKDGLLSASESYGSTESKYYGAYTTSHSDIGKSYSESIIGESESITTINGKNTCSNTVNGNTISTSTNVGDITNTNTVTGNTVSTSTNTGNTTSTNTVTGTTTSTSTNNGSVSNTSTNNGDTHSNNTINGNQFSTSTITGNSDSNSTTVGAQSSMSMFMGAKNDMSLSLSASNSMSVAASASNSMSLNAGLFNKLDITAGLNVMTNITAGLNVITNVNASMDIKNDFNVFEAKVKTTPLEVITEAANVKARIGNIDVEIMTFKIFM